MATPIYITGFEHQAAFSTNGDGLYTGVVGTWALDTSIKHTGSASAKVSVASGVAANLRQTKGVSGTVFTQSVYINFGSSLPGGSVVINLLGVINSANSNVPNVGYNPSTGFFVIIQGTTGKQEDNVTVQTNTWYRIDFKTELTGGNQVVDCKIDGRSITQSSVSNSSTSYTTAFLGTRQTSHAVSFDVYYDDWIYSITGADYPISGGIDYGIEVLTPSSDGTHNAGTNTIEDNAGTDIGATTAYDKINSIPPSSSTYIRQATIGTGNYAEVLFSDISQDHSSIIGAMGVLTYTSAGTAINKGGCIVSKDSFSSNTEIWGTPSATQDYSDGSTSNLFYKTAIISGVTDDTTVNALKARIGYSDDVTPNPYWVDLVIEVAYKVPNTTSLDLVTFSSTFNNIVILESEKILLDLVTYTSTINSINILENENIALDLVSFSSTINDINILIHEIISLDLVTYTSTYNDIDIIVHEVIDLDLISYIITFNDINIIVHEIISLDLVSYSLIFDNLSIIESEIIHPDLVSYFITFPDLTILESNTTGFELVSYSNVFNDIQIIIHEIISLDLVTITIDFPNIALLEGGTVDLDLVTYSSIFNNVSILESEIIPLNLVTYSSIYNSISISEVEVINLDLVSYSSSFNIIKIIESEIIPLNLVTYSYLVLDLSIIMPVKIVKTPPERCYLVLEENRVFPIEEEQRIIAINEEKREILIY